MSTGGALRASGTDWGIIPQPRVCREPLPVTLGVAGALDTLEPADARSLLANVEALNDCVKEYRVWGDEVAKWKR